jgi:hypothetical protein
LTQQARRDIQLPWVVGVDDLGRQLVIELRGISRTDEHRVGVPCIGEIRAGLVATLVFILAGKSRANSDAAPMPLGDAEIIQAAMSLALRRSTHALLR